MSRIQIEAIRSTRTDGLVGEVAWRGTGDDEKDGNALHRQVNKLVQKIAPGTLLEWLVGPCGTPDVNGLIYSTFRASEDMWDDQGNLLTSIVVRLQTCDSTRGFTTVIVRDGKVIDQRGHKYLCNRMLAAYKRGDREVVTSANDVLLMRVEKLR